MEAAALPVIHPRGTEVAPEPRLVARRVAWLFTGTGLALFVVMGLAGLTMRLTQAEVIDLSADWFYRLMTVHGAGMLTGALLAMMGALWFALRSEAPLDARRMLAAYAAALVGAVAVVAAILGGGFATGWTFLWPLPVLSAGAWSTWAAALFLAGLLLVGAGFIVYCLDLLVALTARYGGLERALGIAYLRGRDHSPPPPQALAAMMVSLEGLLASAVGATVIVAEIGRLVDAGAELDALWAKNLTYFFGHSLANLIIYLAAGAVYVLLPRYAGRPWRTTKPIAVAWLGTLVFVATAYSHHLYMDFVQPGGLQVMSSIASFAAALPPAVVTIYTGVLLVWGSRYRWTLASAFLYLGFAGWAIGGTGAVLDSVIPFNFRFHNTLWVVAHFHTYLLLCVIFWALALFVHLLERAAGRPARPVPAVLSLAGLLVGGYGLVAVWYVSGALGLPRRYAVQPLQTEGYSLAGSVFVLVFALGFLVLGAELVWLGRLALARRQARAPAVPGPVEVEPKLASSPPTGPLAPGVEVALAVGAAVVALTVFFPPVTDAVLDDVRLHHLQHAGQFLFGALLGLALAALPALRGRLARLADPAMLVVIAAPAGMLLAMLPAVYAPLETREALHVLYHVGVAALGLLTGLACGALGRTAGRLAALLSLGMAVMYAAGVTGGQGG